MSQFEMSSKNTFNEGSRPLGVEKREGAPRSMSGRNEVQGKSEARRETVALAKGETFRCGQPAMLVSLGFPTSGKGYRQLSVTVVTS